MRYSALILAATLISSTFALAAPTKKPDMALEAAKEKITKELKTLDPNIPIEEVAKTDWENVYSVTLKGGNVIYASPDGKHLLRGDMLKIENGQISNLTETIRSKATADLLKTLKTEDMIVFKPKGDVKGVVYAFTDVDCGYCRKLHQEVPEMNELGIEVRYLAFPRGGSQSPAYSKMTEAWCASDRKQALSELKSGQEISKKASKEEKAKTQCEKLVEEQFQLGLKMGVSGTPALFLADGKAIPGYRPAKQLAEMMGIKSDKPASAGNGEGSGVGSGSDEGSGSTKETQKK